MSAEEKAYIETKSLGKIRVVRVDMSQRMRQNSNPNEQIKRQDVQNEQMVVDETDDIYALLQQIQAKRDSIFMEHEVEHGSVIKRVSNLDQYDENIPAFKRRIVLEKEVIAPVEMNEEKKFNWDEEAYWDPPEKEDVVPYHEATKEIQKKIYHHENETCYTDEIKPEIKAQTYQEQYQEAYREEVFIHKLLDDDMIENMQKREEQKQYVDELQTGYEHEKMDVLEDQQVADVEKEKVESIKLIVYTVLIIIVDILLILLLHSKGSLFGESDLDDITRYICIFIKYAVVVHLLVTIYSIYKDKKGIKALREE